MASFAEVYPTPVERQYTRFYNREIEQFAHLHKNNSVCMIGLTPKHPLITGSSKIVSVEYSKAAASSEALGKRKRGALGLRPDTAVCTITTADGVAHRINAQVNADLVEINERLAQHPDLLVREPEGAGFLCICLTRAESNMGKCFPGFTKEGDIMKFRNRDDS